MNKQHSITRRYLLPAIIIIVVFLSAAQLMHPKLNTSPVSGDFQAPDSVKNIIKRACYDCHSNETDLRWYDKIPVVSWQVAQHIKDGRAGLNFSNWTDIAPAAQKAKLWEAVNQIAIGAMPLQSYQIVHSSAKISASDLFILKKYLLSMVENKPADTAKINAADRQLKNWKNSKSTDDELPVTLNGITYIPDYKNWQPISTTERFDNGTMRVIFGNDVAIKAIKEKQINPWPNGAIIAKVAWDQIDDGNGNIRTGEFKQVEYMIKDDKKYKTTKGWGFARFKTPKLVPYGTTTMAVQECVACHKPMANNDYVFTQPLQQ